MTPTARSFPRRLPRWRRALAGLLLPALLGLASGGAVAGAPRDRLTLLVPDGADLSAWQVKVWIDSAADEGVQLSVITDTALLALGSTAASKIAGLVVPDSAHIKASAAVVAAIKQYAYTGGRLMLVYDAGVLTDAGFYPSVGNSRFADLVGVDYAFWNNGAGANTIVGFGQVVGTKARLESLSMPPGKYMPYVPPASLATPTTNTAFVPTSQYDPGGTQLMAELVQQRATKGIDDGSQNLRGKRPYVLRELLGPGAEGHGMLRFGGRNQGASNAINGHMHDYQPRSSGYVDAVLSADGKSYTERGNATVSSDSTLQAISGYIYGPLGYFHYVTTGAFPGTVYLSSPEHGLVAGQRAYGSGQVLFVNLPLGYFKAWGTDSAPMQGFLNLFARDLVGVSTLSVQPRGKGGLIYNWHVDDGDDLNSDVKDLLNMKKDNPLESGPFSIHFTAGPDVITPGDGNGMDLVNNKKSQDLVKKLAKLKGNSHNDNDDDNNNDDGNGPFHEFGSHGGWIHDFWGLNATEANVPDLTSLLQKNFDAIEKVIGRKLREYSSPVGNTPRWAVRWLENRGVVAMYLVGDVGSGMVRSWRRVAPDLVPTRLANKLWTSPVTPLGKYATFEEFDAFGITDAVSGQWLLDLQSFAINARTNRLFYNHPPGALAHLNPITTLLKRAASQQSQGRFNWYTMTQLADFSQRRIQTSWSTSPWSGYTSYTASNASGLGDVTWLLPKSHFSSPVITWGSGSVSSDSKNWIITAEGGTQLQFLTTEQ